MFGFGKAKASRGLLEAGEDRISKIVRQVVQRALDDSDSALKLAQDLHKTRAELEKLKIEKARMEEGHERADREIKHKVGLERSRQEQELALGKREALVGVKEENLTADRKRFEDQLKFHEDRFSREIDSLNKILAQLMDRLPTIKVNQKA